MSTTAPTPRRRWPSARTSILAAAVLIGGFVLLQFGQRAVGVGRADVDVAFVVTDADSEAAIPDATIRVYSADVLLVGSRTPLMVLSTDRTGTANTLCRDVTRAGSSGYWTVNLPDWRIIVAATGFRPSSPIYFHEHRQSVEVTSRPRFARLVIRVPLESELRSTRESTE